MLLIIVRMDLDAIIVKRENWEQLALAVGDTNPIHYGDRYRDFVSRPICPGTYLFSIAEQRARERGYFTPPMNISAHFRLLTFDNQKLYLEEKVESGAYSLSFNDSESGISTASFNFKNSLFGFLDQNLENVTSFSDEINKTDLDSFNQSLGINGNEIVYSTFVVGRVLKYFLKNREGALLHNMSFDFLNEANLGLIRVGVNVMEKHYPKKKITSYDVEGNVYQGNKIIGSGIGRGFLKRFIT